MRKLTTEIRRRAPGSSRDYQANLLARIRAAGLEGVRPDDERVIKEVVFFADRADITEELTRLESHFGQFDDCARSGNAVGRMLDFLAQEMGREINTIGAKANDAGHLARRGVVQGRAREIPRAGPERGIGPWARRATRFCC